MKTLAGALVLQGVSWAFGFGDALNEWLRINAPIGGGIFTLAWGIQWIAIDAEVAHQRLAMEKIRIEKARQRKTKLQKTPEKADKQPKE